MDHSQHPEHFVPHEHQLTGIHDYVSPFEQDQSLDLSIKHPDVSDFTRAEEHQPREWHERALRYREKQLYGEHYEPHAHPHHEPWLEEEDQLVHMEEHGHSMHHYEPTWHGEGELRPEY